MSHRNLYHPPPLASAPLRPNPAGNAPRDRVLGTWPDRETPCRTGKTVAARFSAPWHSCSYRS